MSSTNAEQAVTEEQQISIEEIYTGNKKISITKGNETIGYLNFIEVENGNYIYISYIEVKNEYRNKGYGTRLLKEVENYAKKNKYKDIRADVLNHFSIWINSGYEIGRKDCFDIGYPVKKIISGVPHYSDLYTNNL